MEPQRVEQDAAARQRLRDRDAEHQQQTDREQEYGGGGQVTADPALAFFFFLGRLFARHGKTRPFGQRLDAFGDVLDRRG